jgi:cell division protein FtsL
MMVKSKKNRYLRGTFQKRRRARKPSPFLFFFFLLVILAATLGYVWIRVYVTRQQGSIATMEKQIEDLKAGNEYLRAELQDLSGPNQLEATARSYGFIYPQSEQIVRIVHLRSF